VLKLFYCEVLVTIDGVAADRVVFPESLEQLSQCVRDEKDSIVPVGAGTQLEFGNPLKRVNCAVGLTRLNRITTYNPAELTIHVEAGVTLDQIQSALAANNQTLPLDPWNGGSATIGGIAAASAQGPLRATGTIRDWIIGMTVVHVDGRKSKTGGRVVKNVTGYDLAKLYTGSLGTLAIIAEISFKLRPSFAKTATAVAHFNSAADAEKVLATLRTSKLQPIACELVGPEHALWIRFGEHPQAVDSQIAELPKAAWKVLQGEDESAGWEKLRKTYAGLGPIVLRVVGKPSEVQSIIESYRPVSWIAHALNGIVLMSVQQAETIDVVRESFPAVIERAPAEIRQRKGTFGVRGAVKRLMLDMKHTFDPERRLNPGRHVDGE
jgi:glycolate oxidase FAD binding subunit